MTRTATIIPTLRYRDASAAVAWLCRAFGFVTHAVYRDDDGKVMHAQLALPAETGHGMIMVSPVRDGHEFDTYQGPSQPRATMSAYVIIADVDAHHDRTAAAGATIVLPLTDDHGGRLYSCLDLEGHLWNFGSYDPWVEPPTE